MTTENIQAACVALAQSMLSPEQFGHAVTAEVRDAARKALGRAPVEQAQYLNAAPVTDEQIGKIAHSSISTEYFNDDQLCSELFIFARALLSAAPADHVRGVTEMVVEAKPVADDAQALVDAVDQALRAVSAVPLVYTHFGVQEYKTPARVKSDAISAVRSVRLTTAMLAAAPKQPAPEVMVDAVLDQPAQVGGGVFHKGIKHSAVILAAQRYYQWRHDNDRPKPYPDRWNASEIASLNEFIKQGNRQFVDLRDYETLQRQLIALQAGEQS